MNKDRNYVYRCFIAILIIVILLVIVLAACQSDVSEGKYRTAEPYNITIVYIGEMPCAKYSTGYKGGLSCDWSKFVP